MVLSVCRNVPPARPQRPSLLAQKQNSSAGAAAPAKPAPTSRPPVGARPVLGTAVQPVSRSDSSSQPADTNEGDASSYANEVGRKKPLVPKGWSPAVKFQPTSPSSESTSISFQNGNAVPASSGETTTTETTNRAPVKAATKPPVPKSKPPINRSPSNPGSKPPIARKPILNLDASTNKDCSC